MVYKCRSKVMQEKLKTASEASTNCYVVNFPGSPTKPLFRAIHLLLRPKRPSTQVTCQLVSRNRHCRRLLGTGESF